MCARLSILFVALAIVVSGAGCTLVGYNSLNVDLQSSEEGGSQASGGIVVPSGGGGDPSGTGGAVGTGGVVATGGAPSSGGTEGSGGAQASGGAIADSGMPDAGGGTLNSGGAPASGGADAAMPDAGSGGDASGGAASGGVGSGGDASGGMGSGGAASGGVGSGGDASGGVASGGVGSGGVTSGGVLGSGGTPDPTYKSVLHRYDFSGVGAAVVDRAGVADAVIYDDTPPDGEGFVDLDGVDDYIEFPSGMLSSLDAFTIALWVNWDGGACDQALLSFGSHAGLPQEQGTLINTLGIGPHSCDGLGGAGATFIENGANIYLDSVFKGETARVGTTSFIALTVDRNAQRWTYYMNGLGAFYYLFVRVDSRSLPSGFSRWVDESNWLGRGQDGSGLNFRGTIDEFRVYKRALTEAEVSTMRAQGPDTVYDP